MLLGNKNVIQCLEAYQVCAKMSQAPSAPANAAVTKDFDSMPPDTMHACAPLRDDFTLQPLVTQKQRNSCAPEVRREGCMRGQAPRQPRGRNYAKVADRTLLPQDVC